MNKIIIVADRGHFKAYRVSKEDPLESPRISLAASYDTLEGHGKMSEKVTDRAGRFGLSGGKEGAAKGFGEAHAMEQEKNKKLVRMIADNINSMISRTKCDVWYLAAASHINRQITENLKPKVLSKLDKNVTADLTKVDKSEILSYFE